MRRSVGGQRLPADEVVERLGRDISSEIRRGDGLMDQVPVGRIHSSSSSSSAAGATPGQTDAADAARRPMLALGQPLQLSVSIQIRRAPLQLDRRGTPRRTGSHNGAIHAGATAT